MKTALKTAKNSETNYHSGKARLLIGHYYLKIILLWQNLFAKAFVREITELSASLTENIFPKLQEINQNTVIASPSNDKTDIILKIDENNTPITVPRKCPNLSSFLTDIEINQLRLDSRLESDQILKALTILHHAGKDLHLIQRLPEGAKRQQKVTAILQSKAGLNAFCCNIQVDLPIKTISITYSYCELFYSFTVKTILQRYTRTKNHQAIFSLAPRFGFLIALLFFLHHIFWAPFSFIGITAASLGATGLGFGIAYLISTLASTIYDQEHSDKLLQEHTREIRALSYFPVHNPNPIMKISQTGEVMYANDAAYKQAEKLGFSKEKLTEILPKNFRTIITTCLSSNREIQEIDSTRHGHTLRYKISPYPNERAALIAGMDITRIKDLECELRTLNKDLEKLVKERTEELQSTQDIAILSLSSLAESRDQETGAHLQRTRLYVKILAEHLRNHPHFQSELDDDKTIDLLFRSAPLHDIGKVGIPDAILLKGTELTEEEFSIMKQHPIIGGDSLQWAETKLGENSFLKLARQIAYYHHEWWDGTGYPFALAGLDIPISSRMMAVADVYDALRSRRVYKEPFSHEKSKAILLKGKGTHFDPDIIAAFIELEEDFIHIHTTNATNA